MGLDLDMWGKTCILTKGEIHEWVQVGHAFLVYTHNCTLKPKSLAKEPVLYQLTFHY